MPTVKLKSIKLNKKLDKLKQITNEKNHQSNLSKIYSTIRKIIK